MRPAARLPVSRAVTLEYLFPPAAIVIAWTRLGEVPNTLSMLGGAIALVGVALVNRRGDTRTSDAVRESALVSRVFGNIVCMRTAIIRKMLDGS